MTYWQYRMKRDLTAASVHEQRRQAIREVLPARERDEPLSAPEGWPRRKRRW